MNNTISNLSIKEQLILIKKEAPDIFGEVIGGKSSGIFFCPSFFGLENGCSKKVHPECEDCWNRALK